MVTKTLVQAREELGDLLNRVTYGNERIVVTRHGKPAAAIVPIHNLEVLEKLEELLNSELAMSRLAEIEGKGSLTVDEFKRLLGMQ